MKNKEEQVEMEFMKEYEQRETDRIMLLQYENLRECLRENLIKPILGEDYYNMGMCAYSCDKFTTQDLARKFKRLKEDRNLFAGVAITSLILNIIFVVQLLITF